MSLLVRLFKDCEQYTLYMCQHKLCSIKFLVSTLSPSLLAAALFQAPIIHLKPLSTLLAFHLMGVQVEEQSQRQSRKSQSGAVVLLACRVDAVEYR